MNKFTNIGIVQKIIIALVIVTLFNFCAPTAANAATLFGAGGSLLEPVFDLLIFVADGALGLMQGTLLTKTDLIIGGKTEKAEKEVTGWIVLGVVLLAVATVATCGVVGAAVGAAATVAGFWATAGAIAGALATSTTLLAGASGIGVIVCGSKILDGLSGKFDLPDVKYSPYAIFSGAIPAFDINFINPMETVYEVNDEDLQSYLLTMDQWGKTEYFETIVNVESWEDALRLFENQKDNYNQNDSGVEKIYRDVKYEEIKEDQGNVDNHFLKGFIYYLSNDREIGKDAGNYGVSVTAYKVGDTIYLGNLLYEDLKSDNMKGSAEIKIYSGTYQDAVRKTAVGIYSSSAMSLKNVISNGYKALLKLAFVLLMVILVYVGIRIVLCSTSSDKSKYKKMLVNWFVALCLLFVLHIIMLFIITISQSLTSIFTQGTADAVVIPMPKDTEIKVNGDYVKMTDLGYTTNEEGNPIWITSYMGYIRLLASGQSFSGEGGYQVGYLIIYIILVIYTAVFTFMYIKRVIYMAFLTLIAPLIAITYPLDKIKDGQAQAFNMWITEYIFNALLQPIHMLIYLLLISSVLELAANYPIYSIVAMGFMIPAEKFIRNMFGFAKSKTASPFTGAAAAGLAMSGVNKIGALGKGKDVDKDESDNSDRVYYSDAMSGMDAMQDTLPDSLIPNSQQVIPQPVPTPVPTPTPIPTPVPVPVSVPQGNGGKPMGYYPPKDAYEARHFDRLMSYANQNNDISLKNWALQQLQAYRRPVPVQTSTPKLRQRFINSSGRHIRGLIAAGNTVKVDPIKPNIIIKGIAKGVGAIGLGTVGLAAGVASGDLGNAGKYTAAGVLAGMNIAGSMAGNSKVGEAIEGFKQGYYGEEYQARVNAKALREFKQDGKNRNVFARNLSTEEVHEIEERIDSYHQQNITKAEDMVATYKLEKHFRDYEGKGEDEAMKAAIGTVKISKRMGSDPRNNPDAETKWKTNFTEKCTNKYGSNAESAAKEIMDRVKKYYDIQQEIK